MVHMLGHPDFPACWRRSFWLSLVTTLVCIGELRMGVQLAVIPKLRSWVLKRVGHLHARFGLGDLGLERHPQKLLITLYWLKQTLLDVE